MVPRITSIPSREKQKERQKETEKREKIEETEKRQCLDMLLFQTSLIIHRSEYFYEWHYSNYVKSHQPTFSAVKSS